MRENRYDVDKTYCNTMETGTKLAVIGGDEINSILQE